MNTYQLTEHLLTLDEATYPLTTNTYQSLRNGIIPKELRLRITQTQGEEHCWDFCRKCRLISKIRTQVQNGEQPEHILPLVESGLVSSELLFKLYHHNLKHKAEKLFSKHLISQEVLNTVRRSLLTEEILPELNHAILIETAHYLWEHGEITGDILQAVRKGEIDAQYIHIIRRYARQLKNLSETEQSHASYRFYDNDGNEIPIQAVAHPDATVDKALLTEIDHQYLVEALSWLSESERNLIQAIYMDQVQIIDLAKEMGVSEGTVRYRRNQTLAKLRMILVDVLKMPRNEN